MRFLSTLVLVMAGAAGLLAACGGGGGNNNTGGGATGTITCDPGENIFCRCPGGEAGTKTCRPDGHSFEECVTREGPCPEIPMVTSSSTSSSSTTSSGGGMGGMGTGGGSLAGFLEPCAKDENCADGMKCPYGYCTKDCAKFDECTLGVGECISFRGEQICMPVCTDTADCEAVYAQPSKCGYTTAVDGTPVTTCTDWDPQQELKVPPQGTNCMDDIACNLGNAGLQAVCSFETCTKGCYVQADCPTNTSCSSNGATLGSCE